MIVRRALLFALVTVLAAGAGLAAREVRGARADRASDEDSNRAAAAPTATPAPKWSTRRIELPPELAPWSVRMSPDGTAIAGVTPQAPDVGHCTTIDKLSPPSCKPPQPSRVLRFEVIDPPGEITARLSRVAEAPESGGFSWLPDGGLAVASLDIPGAAAKASMKRVTVTIIEKDGRQTALGSVEGGSLPPLSPSPDGKWLAVAQTQPAAIRFIDRRTGASKAVEVDLVGLPVALGWSADGRVLLGKDSTVFRVSPDGAIDRIAGPDGARLAGVASSSPDGSISVFRANRPQVESLSALIGERWVDVPLDALRSSSTPIWVTSREILLRTATGALAAYEPRSGAVRNLGFTLRASDPRILAFAEPYLMWRDGEAGRIHLLDTRSAYDAIVGVTDIAGVQTYAGGGFLILHPNGAELLTGADWFARLPPTAAPFASAGPPKPGTNDLFRDIKALPRRDQMTTGGALTVESRTAALKRVKAEDGGWSLEVPLDWRADVGRLRGTEIYSFDPTGRDHGGNAPAQGEVRMSLTLWPDPDRRGSAWFAEHQSRPGRVTSRDVTQLTLAGVTAYRVLTTEESPGPFSTHVGRWYLAHPSFSDRVIEVILYRADETTLAAADRALGTLRLFEPVSGPREPLLSRREAIDRAFAPAAKPTPLPTVAERTEAKLVTNKELERAQASGASYSLDLDTPVWVIVRFGDLDPIARGGRGISGAPSRWGWRFAVIDARTGVGFSGGGGGPPGGEPAWWSLLRDRAP